MFVISCSSCSRHQLIFPSQVVRVHAGFVTYRCWCGSEQDWVPGERAAQQAA